MRILKQSIFFRILLSFLLFLGFLRALDLMVRVSTGPVRYPSWFNSSITYLLDDQTGWKLEPKVFQWGQVNSDFFRGSSLPKMKAPRKCRIAVVGGSAAFDLWKTDQQTWASQLENLLKAKLGESVEIMNTGTPGYSTWQVRGLVTGRLSEWNPDVVLLYELFNDSITFSRPSKPEIIEKWKLNANANYIGKAAHPNATFDVFSMLMPSTVDALRMSIIEQQIQSTLLENNRYWQRIELDLKVRPEGLDFYKENRVEIARFLAKKSAMLIVASQASLINKKNSTEEKSKILYAFRGMNHDEMLKAYAIARKIDEKLSVDESNVVFFSTHARVPQNLQYFVDEVHLTSDGSRVLAESLAEFIINKARSKKGLGCLTQVGSF